MQPQERPNRNGDDQGVEGEAYGIRDRRPFDPKVGIRIKFSTTLSATEIPMLASAQLLFPPINSATLLLPVPTKIMNAGTMIRRAVLPCANCGPKTRSRRGA